MYGGLIVVHVTTRSYAAGLVRLERACAEICAELCTDGAPRAWEDAVNGMRPASCLLLTSGGGLVSLYCWACAIFHGGGGGEALDEGSSDERDTAA